MKGLYKAAAGPGSTLAELPEPAPGPNDVTIRVARPCTPPFAASWPCHWLAFVEAREDVWTATSLLAHV